MFCQGTYGSKHSTVTVLIPTYHPADSQSAGTAGIHALS